jgi:hypothetical protein
MSEVINSWGFDWIRKNSDKKTESMIEHTKDTSFIINKKEAEKHNHLDIDFPDAESFWVKREQDRVDSVTLKSLENQLASVENDIKNLEYLKSQLEVLIHRKKQKQ